MRLVICLILTERKIYVSERRYSTKTLKMDKIQISGQKKIEGEIKISGSKNSCLPILAATVIR